MSADTLCWTDIPVTNLDRAIKFYSAVLRQEVSKMSEGGVEYGLLPHEEQNASGCLCVSSDSVGSNNQPSQTGPLIYLSMADCLMVPLKPRAEMAEKCLKKSSRSVRTVFVLLFSIRKAIASPCIRPDSSLGSARVSRAGIGV